MTMIFFILNGACLLALSLKSLTTNTDSIGKQWEALKLHYNDEKTIRKMILLIAGALLVAKIWFIYDSIIINKNDYILTLGIFLFFTMIISTITSLKVLFKNQKIKRYYSGMIESIVTIIFIALSIGMLMIK